MPVVPAFCNTCGTAFSSGIFVENSSNVSFAGNMSGPCPKCGGMGHVPDGVFNFIGNTIEILSAPERTIHELVSLARILKEARAKAETKAQVESRIKTELPGLSLLGKLLPENKSELYGFLSVILAALALYTQPTETPPAQTIININQVIESTILEAKKESVAKPQPASGPKQGRNEPCNCGSDKKYKKCCGSIN